MHFEGACYELALKGVLEAVYDDLRREGIRWAVIGSVATALQGCQVVPHDIDILAINPEGVVHFAKLLSAYAPANYENARGNVFQDPNWRLSEEMPVYSGSDQYGFLWHFARWFVANYDVQVAHIAAPEGHPISADGAGIWEVGPGIWPHLRKFSFMGYHVPVVPLEIQLETNLNRGLENRVDEIVAFFPKKGHDRGLMQRSLSKGHLEMFRGLMQKRSGY
jgi:hypothetical protein